MPRTVLLITYEFPPSAGAGVQRMAKFARYLPDSGWSPVVLTAEPIPGRPVDDSLTAPVADIPVRRTPARHVGTAVAQMLAPLKRSRAQTGAPASQPASVPAASAPPARHAVPLSSRISRLVAVPDDAAFWIAEAVRDGITFGREHSVEAVVASGPPHSVLIAGSRIARALGVPFVADMRDAWRDNPGGAFPTSWHRKKSALFEQRALSTAAVVTCVSQPIADEAAEMGGRSVRVLPNGFDPVDITTSWQGGAEGPLTVAYMGRFYGSHDPAAFFEGFAKASESAELRFSFTGPDPDRVQAAASRLGFADRVDARGYAPHREALARVAAADVGLVVITDEPGAKANYTGKLFEYLGMGIPTLVVGPPDGAAADLVRAAGAGEVAADGDPGDIARALLQLSAAKAGGWSTFSPDTSAIRRFERPAQAAELASILDEVTR